MKFTLLRGTAISIFVALACLITVAAAAQSNPACTLPATTAPTNEQTAWQIFVAANCPASGGGGPLTWENWTEQTCWLAPTTPGCSQGTALTNAAKRFLHPSVLREHTAKLKKLGAINPLNGACNGMTTAADGSAYAPFVPKNLAKNPQFCEEVFVNAAEAAFVKAPAAGYTLTNLTSQAAYGASHGGITFPTAAVEVKADWLPAASINPTFNCKTPPKDVYVEMISGSCYALAGIHISSKLSPNWLWATFEPQSAMTNPNRCNPKLYDSCNDPWGSTPASSSGTPTAATPALLALMKAAGLPAVFQNYRLTGVQTTFVNGANQPIPLGNSFTEFNATVLPHQASCITCHSYSGIKTTSKPPTAVACCTFSVMVGTPPATPAGVMKDDFSWMLPFMPSK